MLQPTSFWWDYIHWWIERGPRESPGKTLVYQLNEATYEIFCLEETFAEKLGPAIEKAARQMQEFIDAWALTA